jgi:hypothetical protein
MMGLKHRLGRLNQLAARTRPHKPYPDLASILSGEGPPVEMRHYGPTRWLILRVPPGTSLGPLRWGSLAAEQRARIGPRTKLMVGLSPDDI